MTRLQSPPGAIILVAGRARRLGRLTRSRPKCLLDVAGTPLLGRTLEALSQQGIDDVMIVVGHLGEQVRRFVRQRFGDLRVRFVENPRYDETNTAYSLWLAREHLVGPCMLLEGDILMDAEMIGRVLEVASGVGSAWAAVPVTPGNDEGILLRADSAGLVSSVERVLDPLPSADRAGRYKCAGIQLLSAPLAEAFATELDRTVERGKLRMFADLVLARSMPGNPVALCSFEGSRWAEIDTPDDYRDTVAAAEAVYGADSRPKLAEGY